MSATDPDPPEDGEEEEEDDDNIEIGVEPTEDEDEDDDNIQIDIEPTFEVDPLAVEDELSIVDADVTEEHTPLTAQVAGIALEGVHTIRFAGEGREEQYLREIESGGGDDADNVYGADNDLSEEAEEGGEEDQSDGPEGGEEPPLRITFEGYFDQTTAQDLVGLREQDELFTVIVGDDEYDEMELHDFERALYGDRPYAYEGRVVVQEWREYEVASAADYTDVYDSDSDPDSDTYQGGLTEEDPTNEMEEWEESGSDEYPNIIELDEGEERTIEVDNQDIRNVIIDESASGSNGQIRISGDGWTIENVGFRSFPNDDRGETPQIIAEGSGTIENVYLGSGAGSDAIVVEDPEQIDLVDVSIGESRNGVTAVDATDVNDYEDFDEDDLVAAEDDDNIQIDIEPTEEEED